MAGLGPPDQAQRTMHVALRTDILYTSESRYSLIRGGALISFDCLSDVCLFAFIRGCGEKSVPLPSPKGA